MRIKRSELTVDKYTAPEGKLLIKPFPHMKRTVTTTEFKLKEREEGEDPTKEDEPEYEPYEVKSRAPFEVQLAEVVAVGNNSKYNVGDIIIYSIKFVKEFDLFKDTFLVSDYDLYGKYEF